MWYLFPASFISMLWRNLEFESYSNLWYLFPLWLLQRLAIYIVISFLVMSWVFILMTGSCRLCWELGVAYFAMQMNWTLTLNCDSTFENLTFILMIFSRMYWNLMHVQKFSILVKHFQFSFNHMFFAVLIPSSAFIVGVVDYQYLVLVIFFYIIWFRFYGF